MPPEPQFTVLFVEPDALPAPLEAALSSAGFVCEPVDARRVSGMILVACPDAVITPAEQLGDVARAIRSMASDTKVPLFVVGSRSELARLRQRHPPEVTGLVPNDLPPIAIAKRLRTAVASRGASSGPPSRAATSRRRTEVGLGRAVTPEAKTNSGRAVTPEARTNSGRVPAPEAAPGRVSTSQAAPGQAAHGRVCSPAGAPGRVVQPKAALGRVAPGKAVPAQMAGPEADLSGAVTPAVRPIPKRRVSLETPAVTLPPLRLALLDEDSARADSVAQALRSTNKQVFPLSTATPKSRWARLRSFAPQGVIVDESEVSKAGGAWLAEFRADPFLGKTPIILFPLEDLLDDESGEADVAPLTPQLEGLGRVELAFSAQLRPGTELLVNRSQMNLGRLLELLGEVSHPILLECSDGVEQLHWGLHQGKVAAAQLRRDGAEATTLEPRLALNWLLDHPNAQLLVRDHDGVMPSLLATLTELLAQAYKTGLSAAPATARPGTAEASSSSRLGHPLAESTREPITVDSEFPTQQVDLNTLDFPRAAFREPAEGALSLEAVPTSGASSTSDAVPTSDAPMPNAAQASETQPSMPAAPDAAQGDAVPYAPVTPRVPSPPLLEAIGPPLGDPATELPARREASDSSQGVFHDIISSPESAKRSTWIAAAAVLLIGGSVAWWVMGPSDGPVVASADITVTEQAENSAASPPSRPMPEPETPTPGTNEATNAAAAKSAPEPPEESKPANEALWAIEHPTELPDCESILESDLSELSSRPLWEGQKLWKRARHQMLMGEELSANQLMCQAAYIDPSGPASVGLATYYLSKRSLKNAEQWAHFGIERRPTRTRKSLELLGDTLIQRGEAEKALELWLGTMKLSADDLLKRRAVARSLVASARKVTRGGDYPLAERLLRRAAALDEENAAAASALSVTLFENGEPQLARRWAEKALKGDPAAHGAMLVQGRMAEAAGEIEEARRWFERIPKQSSYSKAARAALAEL